MSDFSEYMNEPEHIDEPKAPIKPIYIFFSHPMYGFSYNELVERRELFINYIRSLLRFKGPFSEEEVDRIQLIDNLNHEELDADAGRLAYLGRSIQKLEGADIVIFDRYKSRGCNVEEAVCDAYDIRYMHINSGAFDDNFISWFVSKINSQ